MMTDEGQYGFTLIELSLVLVIIGLLIGGVLAGKDLIHSAEIRRTISQRDQFDVGVTTFKVKYNCLPGDCDNAFALGVGVDSAFGESGDYGQNGNGDGVIATWVAATDFFQYEAANFWYHLSKARLISWTYDPAFASIYPNLNGGVTCNTFDGVSSSPCIAFSASSDYGKAGWWVWSSEDPYRAYDFPAYGHYWWIGVNLSPADSRAAPLLPMDAYAIDSKIDDGLPLSGIVTPTSDGTSDGYDSIGHPYPPSIGNGGPDNNTCVNDLTFPNSYNVLNQHRDAENLCALLIKASF